MIEITDLRAAILETVKRDESTATVEQSGAAVVPFSKTASDRDELLAALRDAANRDAEQEAVRALGAHAKKLDEIGLEFLRSEMIEVLKKRKHSSPARVADAALGTSTTTDDEMTLDIVPVREPWPSPVDGPELLDDLADTISRHVVLPDGGSEACALWIVHTFAFSRHQITPRLTLLSPEKRSGKTTLLQLIAECSNRPLMAANMSAAVVFRVIEAAQPTLLIDEADTFLGDANELRGVINSGHRKGGCVLRCVGEDSTPRAFACYGCVAIAAIGRLPDTIADRSIIISMRRRSRTELVERLRLDRVDHLHDLARRAARWTIDHADQLDLDPPMPETLHDRARDNWRCLFAIADCVGNGWPERARAAALKRSADGDDDGESVRVALLADLRAIFDATASERMATADILAELVAIEDRSWGDFSHGRPMTAHALGRLLKRFGIAPDQWRVDGTKRERGYNRVQFADAWERYL